MKPPVTWKAVEILVKDMEIHTSNLTSCAACFEPTVHGRTYTKFIRSSTIEILSYLDGLVRSFIDSGKYQDHLLAVGALHECIDTLKLELEAIPDNEAAVRKRWDQNNSSLEDALSELTGIINGEDSDEGWDDLVTGISKSPNGMTEVEKAVCEKSKLFLKLVVAIHKRVFLTFLNVSTYGDLDKLLIISDELCTYIDELVSLLGAPQARSELREVILKVATSVALLQTLFAGSQGRSAVWQRTFDKQYEQSLESLKLSIESLSNNT